MQGDFVHRLIQNGALNFIQQTYKDGSLWTPRDCRIQRTSPNEEAYKEFIKCLTLIPTVAKRYPVKTLQREMGWIIPDSLAKSEWWHSRHRASRHLETGCGQCYCASCTTNGRQNMHRYLLKLQAVGFVERWRFSLPLFPQCRLFRSGFHVGRGRSGSHVES